MKKNNLLSNIANLISKSIKDKIEIEKEISNLKAVTGFPTIEKNKELKKYIKWFRLEYQKRPYKYIGDTVALKSVRKYLSTGFTLKESIDKSYRDFKNEFDILDRLRAYGR